MSSRLSKRPVDAQRRRIFLETLSKTGSFAAASQAATPWAKSRRTARNSFRDLARRDPEFKEQVEAAKGAALALVEEEIFRRAVEGYQGRPVFSNGKLVAWETKKSDALLLRLAEVLAPERWVSREKVEVEGQIGLVAVPMAPVNAEEWATKHRVIDPPALPSPQITPRITPAGEGIYLRRPSASPAAEIEREDPNFTS